MPAGIVALLLLIVISAIEAGIALAAWLMAAFVLKLGLSSRVAMTIGLPMLLAAALAYGVALPTPIVPDPHDAWTGQLLALVLAAAAGCCAALLALPVWYLAEARWGGFGRD